MKKGYTIREKIIMLFTAIFVIFSLIVLGNIIFNNTTLFNVTKPLLIVTFIIGYLFVIFLLYKILKKNKKKLLDKKILIIAIIFILLITIQVIYAYNSYTEYGWDCGKVLETAEKLLTNHEFDSIYYSQYYNNIFIVLFFKNLFSILGKICSIYIKNIQPKINPTVAGIQLNFSKFSDIFIDGIIKDQIEAANIRPAANPKNNLFLFSERLFFKKNTVADPIVVPKNGINIPIMINKNSCILTSFIDS